MTWRRLLHRWFVEYNPLYLLSALLVLSGIVLLSRGLADGASVLGQIGVAAIAEAYAVALLGGAALLTRIGQRRPAVMLALLAVLYQGDLTLHTEACANLGAAGLVAALAWVALFFAKLHGLAWAMRVRVDRRALVVAVLGAAGLAVLPHVLPLMGTRTASAVIVLWGAALVTLWQSRGVTSRTELDVWGQTVLERTVRATWALWSVLLILHVVFWSLHVAIDRPTLLLAVPLVGARWLRGEASAWAVTASSLILAGMHPEAFSTIALVAAIALGLRARAANAVISEARRGMAAPTPSTPYRVVGDAPAVDAQGPPGWIVAQFGAARTRLLVGAASSLYLAVWTAGWTRGPFPPHVLAADLVFTGVLVLLVVRVRARTGVLPLVATWLHFVVQARLVPAPRSGVEWGVVAVGLGFLLLFASLAVSYLLREGARPPVVPSSGSLDAGSPAGGELRDRAG